MRSKSPIFLPTENMRIAIRIASFAALLCCQRKAGLSFKQHYTIRSAKQEVPYLITLLDLFPWLNGFYKIYAGYLPHSDRY